MMKTIGKILLCAAIMLVGIYWAASNPTTAKSVKKAADNAVSSAKDAVTD